MGEKALEVYQGDDWLTYHWPVAQMFDTLDRVRDLCRRLPAAAKHGLDMGLSRYETSEDPGGDLFACIAELCDGLLGELDAVLADLFAPTQCAPASRWAGFEMRLHIADMRAIASASRPSLQAADADIDAIAALAARLRDLLKQIDQ